MSFLNNHYDLLLFLNFSFSILFIVIAIPLILKKVPPNAFYGFRVSKSLKSPENWYGINAYWAKHCLIWASLQFLLTLIAACFKDTISFSAVYFYSLMGFFLIPIIMTFIHMNKNY